MNVVVKTVNSKKKSNFNNHKSNQKKKKRVSSVDDTFDAEYERDKQQILQSNKNINLEAIMKLRYSSDEESTEEEVAKRNKCLAQFGAGAAASKTVRNSTNFKEADQEDLVRRLMGKTTA